MSNKEEIANLFRKLTHGVYVIGVVDGEQVNAFTAAWVMHVSFDPLILAISINPNHSSYTMVENSKVFSVNVLNNKQLELAMHFGKPSSTDKLADIKWHIERTGAPIIDESLAYFECRVTDKCQAGDHVIITGRVINGAVLDQGASPLLYSDTENVNGSARLYPDSF